MTKEELYEEFKQVTHFTGDEYVKEIHYINKLKSSTGEIIGKDFEGIGIVFIPVGKFTYFHNPRLSE